MTVLLQTSNLDSFLWVKENYTPDYTEIIKQLPLESHPIVFVWGKERRQNRNVGFFSDISRGYLFSGRLTPSKPLTPFLRQLMEVVNFDLKTSFNGILINEYETGDDYIGPHSDDEKGLDKNQKYVAALSYGAQRTFRIRNKLTKQIVMDYEIPSQSLLVMGGEFQTHFTHELPVRKGRGPRWSLTFRHHVQ